MRLSVVGHIYKIYMSTIPGLHSLLEIDVDDMGYDLMDFGGDYSRWVKKDIPVEECILLTDLLGGRIEVGSHLLTPAEYSEKYIDNA